MLEPITVLREAVETVRAQIPKGELTRQSVLRLLEAAEAVCKERAEPAGPPARAERARPSKRQEARARWARIARENEQAHRDVSSAAE